MNINRLSIVIPCYNSQNSLDSVVNEIKNKMQDISYNYEIILINDCSTDSTMNVIRKLSEDDKRILGVCLAKKKEGEKKPHPHPPPKHPVGSPFRAKILKNGFSIKNIIDE